MGRTRNEDSRQRILEAALAGAQSGGYGDLTVEAIAARAGVGKQTVYRWWRSRAEVVLEALREHARSIPREATGHLEGDLRRFLRATFRRATGKSNTVPVLRGLMAEAQLDAAFLPLFRDFIAERRSALGEILRGHVAEGSDLDVTVDMVFGAMWYRMLVGHAKVDAPFADELARLATRQLSGSPATERRRAGAG